MNLEYLNKSRKKIKPGDIFVLRPKGFDYYFGRVIRTDAKISKNSKATANLIYIYNSKSKDKFKTPELHKNNLLIEPCMINNQPWLQGYFENVDFKELSDIDFFHPHCFQDFIFNKHWDEYGNELDKPYEPVATGGLGNEKTVEVDISIALGIPYER